MLFKFPPAIEAGLAAGKYTQVFNSAGVPLSLARDSETGQFVGHAIGALNDSGNLINPVAIPTNLKALQTGLGVLQASTAVIGVGVAANLAISAVSLWQILKLREDVKQLRFEVKEGFLDLKMALRDQGIEIIQRIEAVAQDAKFEQHRLVLVQAYGRFLQATELMQNAEFCQDPQIKNTDLSIVRQILTEALADYRNPQLLTQLCAAGQLRRFECAWAIEQTIALTYQLQNQPQVLSQCLDRLQTRIREDILSVLNHHQFQDQLDLLFPEIAYICGHDLAALNIWQNQVGWTISLPPAELQLMKDFDQDSLEAPVMEAQLLPESPSTLPEQMHYDSLLQKSHPDALLDQLRFMVKPELRQVSELYIIQQAAAQKHSSLTAKNLTTMSDIAVANLYWYFKAK